LAWHSGNFSVPAGHRVDVVWHRSGLEEYFVDGETVLSTRKFEFSGVREFCAGPHRIKIRFSICKQLCKAYCDGQLLVRDVFDEFRQERIARNKIAHDPIPKWKKIVTNIIVFLGVLFLTSWLISLAK